MTLPGDALWAWLVNVSHSGDAHTNSISSGDIDAPIAAHMMAIASE